jgi:DNA-binding transcriptional LysR family regulator
VRFSEAPLDESELFDALISQKVDIVVDVISAKKHSLMEEVLFRDEAVSLTRVGHPRIGETLSREEYFNEQHIALKLRRGDMNTVEFLSETDIPARKVKIETSSISSMLMLASTTDFIASSSRSLAEKLAPRLGLRIHPIPLALNSINFRMLYHRRYEKDQQHMAVREELRQIFSNIN